MRNNGSIGRNPNSTAKPSGGSRRTYHSDRSRSGIGFTCADSDQPGVVAAVAHDERHEHERGDEEIQVDDRLVPGARR